MLTSIKFMLKTREIQILYKRNQLFNLYNWIKQDIY